MQASAEHPNFEAPPAIAKSVDMPGQGITYTNIT